MASEGNEVMLRGIESLKIGDGCYAIVCIECGAVVGGGLVKNGKPRNLERRLCVKCGKRRQCVAVR